MKEILELEIEFVKKLQQRRNSLGFAPIRKLMLNMRIRRAFKRISLIK